MCPHKDMKRSGIAKWSLISKIIREAAKTSASMCPFLMQEPMVEPRLPDILANIKQNNAECATVIYSNMSVLPQRFDWVVKHELLDELHVSFYGPTEKLYAKWQPPLNRAETIGNIRKLWRLKRKHRTAKPQVTVHMLAVEEILRKTAGYKTVKPYVDNIATVYFDTFHGDVPDMTGHIAFADKPSPRVPCQRLWTGMNIHFDGSVVPCCIDYNDENVLGNVNEQTLHQIWLGRKFQQFRRLHVAEQCGEIPMCRNCMVHEHQFSKEWTDYWVQRKTLSIVVTAKS